MINHLTEDQSGPLMVTIDLRDPFFFPYHTSARTVAINIPALHVHVLPLLFLLLLHSGFM